MSGNCRVFNFDGSGHIYKYESLRGSEVKFPRPLVHSMSAKGPSHRWKGRRTAE